MPNTITSQTIQDGTYALVVKVHLNSDGSEETDLVVVDASTFSPAFTNAQLLALDIIVAAPTLQARLEWDANTDVPICTIGPTSLQLDWRKFGGLPNNAGTGVTGDILLTTLGLVSGDQLTMVFYLKKV